ncbi:MAG: hypothetical protein LBU73_05270, partial [Helicobacteraceae bacterium]|nr:hypothetical protein [Helicobacteraceae bacterium]
MGTASLVLAGLGLLLCFSGGIPFGLTLATIGLVLGIIAMIQANQSEDKQAKNIALAGTIISGVTIVIATIMIIFVFIAMIKATGFIGNVSRNIERDRREIEQRHDEGQRRVEEQFQKAREIMNMGRGGTQNTQEAAEGEPIEQDEAAQESASEEPASEPAPSSEYLGFVLGSQTLEDVEEILKKAGADYDLGGYRGYA